WILAIRTATSKSCAPRARCDAMARLTTPNGIEMAYDLIGTGLPLLLIDGITESRRMWDPLIAPLATDHTVLAVDLPGHGESSEPSSYDLPVLAGAVASAAEAVDLDNP